MSEHYKCVTPGCNYYAIFDTNVCESCLANALTKSAENMGTPEWAICGHCGIKFNYEDLVKHMNNLKDQCLS